MQETLSVVMPYYKNERTLAACLASFVQQQGPQAHEIIVVDDGGLVRAADVVATWQHRVPLTLLRSDRAGQSGATNAGIAAAKGDIIVLTCADILAAPQLLAEHQKAHAQATNLAVLGALPYAPTVKMTPFMQFLRTGGVQFDFESIDNKDDVDCLFLYAPNVSVRAERLRSIGAFDPAFTYGYQDTDLGLRLARAGTRFVYRDKAVGYHDHPNDFESFVARQHLMGEAALRMIARYPERPFEHTFTEGAEFALPSLRLYDGLLQDALRIEAQVVLRPVLLRKLRTQLYTLYRLVLLLALYRGALRHPERFPKALRPRIAKLLARRIGAQAHHSMPMPHARTSVGA